MALTERQRDRLLDELHKKVDKILYLLDPPRDEQKQRPVKQDPHKLYGGFGP